VARLVEALRAADTVRGEYLAAFLLAMTFQDGAAPVVGQAGTLTAPQRLALQAVADSAAIWRAADRAAKAVVAGDLRAYGLPVEREAFRAYLTQMGAG
nr:hypothetical protein [Paracoccaceae bacterium]